ncbi:MAG: Rieske 2Fe-2S domain-containing protein [Desulfobacterales bacterium]|nr:Rieske 2Fe-2S domain-containing protein [Desulfobacterales bacterium]
MGLFKRIFGICRTKPPRDAKCWKYSRGKVEIGWARAPELRKPCGAIRLEGWGLPERLLVIYGIDGQYHAFRNECTYTGRRIDPVAGTATLRCCGLSRSTFDYTGKVASGPAKEALKVFRVKTKQCKVIIWLDEPDRL